MEKGKCVEIPDLLNLLEAVKDEMAEAEIALKLHKVYLAKIHLGQAVSKLSLCASLTTAMLLNK